MEKKLIKIIDQKMDWKEAIREGVGLLSTNNYCGSQLSEEIIKSVEKHGPYFIIMPGVALAHAEPTKHNYKIGISLIKFNQVISFSDEKRHDINLLFTLSAVDANSHLDILVKFSNLFTEQENLVEEIIKCQTLEQIEIKIKEL